MTAGGPSSEEASPSRWSRRLLLIGLAILGFAIASSLALYQWGIIPTIWEPFFGSGSRVILHSGLSRLLPIPDAALGALGYLADAVAGAIGGPERYRTMPAVVLFMGVVVGAMGVAGLILLLLQAFSYHQFCTLCLASAALSIALVPLAWPEVRATVHVLLRKGG
ncbi:Vitamin K epoxide reductase family protein [compost metagenome]